MIALRIQNHPIHSRPDCLFIKNTLSSIINFRLYLTPPQVSTSFETSAWNSQIRYQIVSFEFLNLRRKWSPHYAYDQVELQHNFGTYHSLVLRRFITINWNRGGVRLQPEPPYISNEFSAPYSTHQQLSCTVEGSSPFYYKEWTLHILTTLQFNKNCQGICFLHNPPSPEQTMPINNPLPTIC